MNFLIETLKALKVETVNEAIPLIAWVRICYIKGCEPVRITLAPSHTVAECGEILSKFDFSYDEPHCGMKISGTVMLNDGSWLERTGYYGVEWWQHQHVPKFECEQFNWYGDEADSY